jgi:hypothetical protein
MHLNSVCRHNTLSCGMHRCGLKVKCGWSSDYLNKTTENFKLLCNMPKGMITNKEKKRKDTCNFWRQQKAAELEEVWKK